jgi:hypothetical protein
MEASMVDERADDDNGVGNGEDSQPGLARRQFLKMAGISGAAMAAAPLVGRIPSAAAATGPSLLRQPTVMGAPAAGQLHLTFGQDTARSMVASWSTPTPVQRPRVRLGLPNFGFGREVLAEEKMYTDAMTGETVITYHARIDGLRPDTSYTYQALADGAAPVSGTFRTAPSGRAPFRFTSFGDQSIPAKVGPGLQTGPFTPNAGFVVDAIAGLDRQPLFHLLNGDLCYANISDAPIDTWRSFFNTNMPLAKNFPWMPSAGNHENEVGNGPEGYLAYQTWFTLPNNGQRSDWQGNWYSFKVGSVGVVSLNNDDVCYQEGSFSPFRTAHFKNANTNKNDYIRGYSQGAQKRWLAFTLAALRADPEIDWIVVTMHQVAMSSANFNGADLGIREEWHPLFDTFGVDLVVAGHEHHYERTHAVRGADHTNFSVSGKDLLTPLPRSTGADTVVDTTKGTVHMILGGGGHSTATPPASFDDDNHGVVIYDVAAPGADGSRAALKRLDEPSHWSAHRDLVNEYGFGVFDVDPGRPGGKTSITFTYYGTTLGSPTYAPHDSITLTRPRGFGL